MPRTLISDLPGGFGNSSSRLGASGRCATAAWLLAAVSLPIWSCSVWGLPCPGLYRHGRCALTAPFHPYPGAGVAATASVPGKPDPLGYCVSRDALHRFRRSGGGVTEAVSFLWHLPSTDLEVRVPDVIRHTALRSSDFPPPKKPASAGPPAATARSSCQSLVYRECVFHQRLKLFSTSLVQASSSSSPSTFTICCRSSGTST